MKAIILLATLKEEGPSNTEVLCEFLEGYFKKKKISSEIIRLVRYNIFPGTCINMGEGDDWPNILEKILSSDIIIFATPIWWNNYSSEMQKVIERLDELHDEILQGKRSRLEGKVAGIVITGDSDGAQQIIANLGNFFNAIGLTFPPFTSLSVLWKGQEKGEKPTRKKLTEKYKKEYSKTADTMVKQLLKFARK
ncbi:MAG: flavodoxin family protein [bacterium]|nr:flavodoxin family protein [bacterium]